MTASSVDSTIAARKARTSSACFRSVTSCVIPVIRAGFPSGPEKTRPRATKLSLRPVRPYRPETREEFFLLLDRIGHGRFHRRRARPDGTGSRNLS